MTRTKQRLINYHTGKKAEMPIAGNVDYGEIVVRHNAESPELLIKVGDNSFGVFQASGAVQTAIDSAKSELTTSISNLEKSLSGHVANFEQFQTNVQTTYATKEELKSASGSIITAYTQAVADAKVEIYNSATTFATSAVTVAKGELNTSINKVASDLDALSGVVESISTDIGDNYVTSADLKTTVETLEGKISDAQKAATDASSAYTDTKFGEASGYTDSQIKVSEIKTNGLIEGVKSDLGDLKTTVETDYVLKTTLNTKVEELEGKISSAKTEAIGKASGYTDTQIAAAKEYSDGKLSAATESLKQLISDVDENVTALSGNVHTTIENLDSKLTETINNKVAVAYRYQGSVDNYADLPKNLTSGETGYVYNVANANGHIPAGTNYAWNGTAWDALGGIVDLTPYAKASDVKNSIDGINQSIAKVESSVSTLSGNTDSAIASLKQYTDDTFATKTALQTAQNDITTAYTQAIANAKLEAIETASGYTDTQVLAAKNALNQSIEKVDGRVTDLSGVTETVKATADKAVQTASIVDSATCKVSVNKEGTELKFDFSNLVIDCGDF